MQCGNMLLYALYISVAKMDLREGEEKEQTLTMTRTSLGLLLNFKGRLKLQGLLPKENTVTYEAVHQNRAYGLLMTF